jgi:hypothetical protein
MASLKKNSQYRTSCRNLKCSTQEVFDMDPIPLYNFFLRNEELIKSGNTGFGIHKTNGSTFRHFNKFSTS